MSLTVDIHKKLGPFSLDVAFQTSGGVLGLLGASGSGKSMTLKCVAGIEHPDRGRIVLDGVTLFDSEQGVDLPPQKRRVGYLFQSYALFPNMTVRQNILCGLHWQKDRRARERAVGEMVALLQLEGLEQRRPHQLSGGQQQRAALARILANDPGVLMLDEPFSALDRRLREELQVQMQGFLRRFGRDVLLVTHDQDEASRLCSRVAAMDRGRILALGDTDALFDDPGSRQAAFLTGCQNVAPAAVRTGEYEVAVPAWGLRLATARPVGEGLDTVGIHAQALSPACPSNRFPVHITGAMREQAGARLCFRFPGQAPDAPDLWWTRPGPRDAAAPQSLGVDPKDVLLLYHV